MFNRHFLWLNKGLELDAAGLKKLMLYFVLSSEGQKPSSSKMPENANIAKKRTTTNRIVAYVLRLPYFRLNMLLDLSVHEYPTTVAPPKLLIMFSQLQWNM